MWFIVVKYRCVGLMFTVCSNSNQQRVLVPGAGLGRLALEIAAKGLWCSMCCRAVMVVVC